MNPTLASPSDRTIELTVTGMTCGACVRRIEKALRAVPDVREATVNLHGGALRDESPTTLVARDSSKQSNALAMACTSRSRPNARAAPTRWRMPSNGSNERIAATS